MLGQVNTARSKVTRRRLYEDGIMSRWRPDNDILRPVTERLVTALRDASRFRWGRTCPLTRLALHSGVSVGTARPERPTVGEAQKIARVEGCERIDTVGTV